MERTSKGDLRPVRDDVISTSSNTNKVSCKSSGDASDKKLDSNSTSASATGVPPGSMQVGNTTKL